MNNQQAALIAAASQIGLPDVRASQEEIRVATLRLAAHYVTWLDQQDELEAKLGPTPLERLGRPFRTFDTRR